MFTKDGMWLLKGGTDNVVKEKIYCHQRTNNFCFAICYDEFYSVF